MKDEHEVVDVPRALDRIDAKLLRMGASFERTATTIAVHPASADGFEVGFAVDDRSFPADDRSFLVWFAGWHEPFTTADEALSAFTWGLSAECRLRVTYRGSIAVAWTTQHVVDGAWHDDSTTGWLLTPFWLPKRQVFKQNHMGTGQ